MRALPVACVVSVLVACAPAEQDTNADSATGMTETPAATIALADVAGRWDMTATPESGSDTSSTRYTMTATADSTGWTMSFPNRPEPVPLRIVTVAGDSIVIDAGPFESARRPGVQVSTTNVLRKQGDRLVGHVRARYASSGSDTTLTLRTQGTRMP
jgi:hypothetical protein